MSQIFYRFAIDPEVFKDGRNVLSLVGAIGRGRFIGKVPGSWFREVQAAVKNGRGRIALEQLRQRFGNFVVDVEGELPWGADWLEGVETIQEQSAPFRAVVATENPRNREYIIEADMVSELDERWEVPIGIEIERQPEALAHAIAPLLHHKRTIHLVDPYFHPESSAHAEVLIALMREAVRRPKKKDLTFVYNLRFDSDSDSHADFSDAAHRELVHLMPPQCTLELVRWQEKTGTDFHDRFVMTFAGGVNVGAGLAKTYTKGEKTNVVLLDPKLLQKKLAEYDERHSPFKLIDRTTVTSR